MKESVSAFCEKQIKHNMWFYCLGNAVGARLSCSEYCENILFYDYVFFWSMDIEAPFYKLDKKTDLLEISPLKCFICISSDVCVTVQYIKQQNNYEFSVNLGIEKLDYCVLFTELTLCSFS